MGGTFNSLGSAYQRCPVAEGHEQQRAKEFRARVVGQRVVVVADLDFGKSGVVVDVDESKQLRVRLDGDADAYWYSRSELERAR